MRISFLKLLISLLLFVVWEKSYGQKSVEKVSPEEYYAFLNSFTHPDSVLQFNLRSKPDLNHVLRDTAAIFGDTTLFSQADITFIRSQIAQSQRFTWKSNKPLGARIISSRKLSRLFKKEDGWTKFYQKYGKGFITLSVPLFSVDRNTCILYKGQHCGRLCGGGSIRVYKKANGNWVFLKTVGMRWIS